jgi:hypothetical protein
MNCFKIKLVLFVSLFSLAGCDSFVEVDVPTSQLTGSAVFENRATVNAAMMAVYAKLRDGGMLAGNSLGSGACLGMYADELIYYGASNDNISYLFGNTLLPTTSIVLQQWRESYHQIYCANAIIEGCEKSTTLSIEDKNQFIGEATFVRALIYFYLVNLYGDVPYITTTDFEVNRTVSRMSVASVYEKIIADLELSVSLLPEAYVTAERVRPNKATANALLARVLLYHGRWAEASNTASAVLNNTLYVWENDITKVFLKGCTATIWQFSPKLAGNNTDEAASYIFTSGPPPSRGLNPDFVNSFATGDLRRTNWIKTVTNSNGSWYHAHKYKQHLNTGTSVEYSIVFRLSEQYLIRAEARARQGELSGAKEDLNKVRQLAGLSATTAVTAEEIITAVLQERRFELFTEYGHRFFDLKRTNTLDTVLMSVKPGWNATDALWPIPESEQLANGNLTQNLGY